MELLGLGIFDRIDFKKSIGLDDWSFILRELEIFTAIAIVIFEIKSFRINIYGDKVGNYESVLFSDNSKLSSKEILKLIEKKSTDFEKVKVTVEYFGYCWVDTDVQVECTLFTVKLTRSNFLGLNVETSNFGFIPHHPLKKERQYPIWLKNAPRLAKLLHDYSDKSKLTLLTEVADRFDYAIISRNKFYLQNKAITGVNEEGWDEFYIPFDLIK